VIFIEHDVGKVFNADKELIGGTIFLTPEEVQSHLSDLLESSTSFGEGNRGSTEIMKLCGRTLKKTIKTKFVR
jgi:hypothetical protein